MTPKMLELGKTARCDSMRKYGNQGCLLWLTFILVLLTLPIWLMLLRIPLEILAGIGKVGVSIFGEGNGALFLILLMLIFIVILAILIRFLEKKEKKDTDQSP
jgi:hypothetical protein